MSFEPPPLPASYGNLQVWWDAVRAGWRAQFDAQQAAIDALAAAVAAQADATAALADAAAAQTTATTAQTTATSAASTASTASTAATAAQTTADTVKRDDAITVSWTVPDNIITATDAGSNVTVTVAAHRRFYGDGTFIDVGGTSFTGKAYSTSYGIYYDDTTRADTTPPYQITTTLSNAQNNFVAGRHRVGEVDTPAAAGAPTTGGTTPPGSVSSPSSGRYPTY